MAEVSLELFKKHVRSDEFEEDDDLLQHYLDAATSAVVRFTQRTEDELSEMGGGEFPVELVQAIIMLGASWYNQRESESSVQLYSVPNSLQALLKPFRKLA